MITNMNKATRMDLDIANSMGVKGKYMYINGYAHMYINHFRITKP